MSGRLGVVVLMTGLIIGLIGSTWAQDTAPYQPAPLFNAPPVAVPPEAEAIERMKQEGSELAKRAQSEPCGGSFRAADACKPAPAPPEAPSEPKAPSSNEWVKVPTNPPRWVRRGDPIVSALPAGQMTPEVRAVIENPRYQLNGVAAPADASGDDATDSQISSNGAGTDTVREAPSEPKAPSSNEWVKVPTNPPRWVRRGDSVGSSLPAGQMTPEVRAVIENPRYQLNGVTAPADASGDDATDSQISSNRAGTETDSGSERSGSAGEGGDNSGDRDLQSQPDAENARSDNGGNPIDTSSPPPDVSRGLPPQVLCSSLVHNCVDNEGHSTVEQERSAVSDPPEQEYYESNVVDLYGTADESALREAFSASGMGSASAKSPDDAMAGMLKSFGATQSAIASEASQHMQRAKALSEQARTQERSAQLQTMLAGQRGQAVSQGGSRAAPGECASLSQNLGVCPQNIRSADAMFGAGSSQAQQVRQACSVFQQQFTNVCR